MSHSTIDSSAGRSMMQLFEASHHSTRTWQSAQGAGTGGNSVSASGFSQVITQLQQLAASDPTQFKQQSADIATQLTTAAGQSSGTVAEVLQNLASQFQQASQTGQAPGTSGHHRAHHHHHGGSSGASSATGNQKAQDSTNGSLPQIPKNANGYYGPENATDPMTAAIQAGAAGLTIGQTYYVPGVGMCEVV